MVTVLEADLWTVIPDITFFSRRDFRLFCSGTEVHCTGDDCIHPQRRQTKQQFTTVRFCSTRSRYVETRIGI
jgi:hypothetical protein